MGNNNTAHSSSLKDQVIYFLELSLPLVFFLLKFKLARNITDLAGCEQIAPQHLAEALQYRPRLNGG
jgi:predicted ATPase with chaperone activity